MTDAERTRLRKRTVGFVFQKFNLLPNLTARDNIAVARYIGGHERQAGTRVRGVLRLLGIATGWTTSRARSPAASSSASPSRAPS